jgi:hypothetical protein
MAEINPPPDRSSNRIILIAVLVILLLAAGIYLYAGWMGYQEAPKFIEVEDIRSPASDPYTLSPGQINGLDSYGDPEAFTILFYQEETPGQGIQTVRLETWDYYSQGIGLTFINGELVAEDPLEAGDLGSLAPQPYDPALFSAFMSLEDVIAAAGIDSYVEIPFNKEIMEKGILYYADSLSFGMQGGQLVYVEALALIEN